MRRSLFTLASMLLASLGLTIDIYPNNPSGDLFTNPGPSNASQAVGTTNWFYRNVRNNGEVGINGNLPYLGTGSAYMATPSGSAKADLEYWVLGSGSQPTVLGFLSNLESLSYSWYRDGASTVSSWLHPAFRLWVRWHDGSTLRQGYLVYEEIYNTAGYVAPTDQWVDVDVLGKKFWSTGSLPDAFNSYDRTLSDWSTLMPGAEVLALSMGVGSGWNGVFSGAVDNVEFSFVDQSSGSFNFEVQSVPVPEPFTLALGTAGLGAALRKRRRV
jgi:hypothetical protein